MRLRTLLFFAWCLAVAAGFVVLGEHASETGAAGPTPSTWPADAAFAPPGEQGTLLLVAHPQCPCTQATLVELAAALRGLDAPPRIDVLLMAGRDGLPIDLRADLDARIDALPDAQVQLDPGGRDARRFGSLTSGHVLLYAPDGSLRFSGGITGARGHAGANEARFALARSLRALDLPITHPDTPPVYGCPLKAST
jgi:hypothetical protein